MIHKRFYRNLYLGLCLLFLGLSSCQKYEDGPAISFRSKTSRLVGYWKLDKWIENNVEQPNQLKYKRQFGFAKDGTYYYNFADTTNGVVINFEGTWVMRTRNEQLVLGLDDPLVGMQYEVWDITRLTNKEIWLENVSPKKMVEWHLVVQ